MKACLQYLQEKKKTRGCQGTEGKTRSKRWDRNFDISTYRKKKHTISNTSCSPSYTSTFHGRRAEKHCQKVNDSMLSTHRKIAPHASMNRTLHVKNRGFVFLRRARKKEKRGLCIAPRSPVKVYSFDTMSYQVNEITPACLKGTCRTC